MEFKEYDNSLQDVTNTKYKVDAQGEIIKQTRPYDEELLDLLGIIIDENQLLPFGINMSEYNNPTAEVVAKVKAKIKEKNEGNTFKV